MTQIIALAGKAGSGKNAVAEILKYEIADCATLAFADRLKWGLAQMCDVNLNDMSRAEKEAPVPHLAGLGEITPRHLAQTLGTEWGRSIHPDLWVHLLALDIAQTTAPVAIITDCRFPNEVAWVKSQGGVIWWIERDGIAPVRPHASENAIGPQDCDRTILNLGTLDDLADTVTRAFEQLEATWEAAA